MKYVPVVLSLAAALLARHTSGIELIDRQATSGNFIQICPNQNYEPIDDTVTCMNITNPTLPKGYGGRTCFSLADTPLRVGSPQGISSARMFGDPVNCTLYKTENCQPDTPTNGYVLPATGASVLPLATRPGDPYAVDDETVAFNCKPLPTLVGASR